MNKDRARMLQKIIWHIRWVMLFLIMAFNVFSLIVHLHLPAVIAINGIVFAFYFLLGQLDGYFDCKSNCRI